MNKYRQSSTIVVLVICCAFVACSSETAKKDEGAQGSGVPAQGAGGTDREPPSTYQGFVDSITCAAISGWAATANTTEKISVDILVDNRLVGTTRADLLRPDLKELAGTADPNYGFSWPIPVELKDGKTHVVSAKISGRTQEVRIWEMIKPSFTCSGS